MASTDLRECDHSNKLYLQLKPSYFETIKASSRDVL